jgi:head-tail adaptor
VNIGDLRHRIALCSMKDVVEKDGMMSLSRVDIVRLWANVQAQNWMSSFISRAGYATQEGAHSPTHLITIRNQSWIEITSAAWVYEEKLKSAPRWYKVLGFTDAGDWLRLTTHLVERSDKAQPPVSGLRAQPSPVTL